MWAGLVAGGCSAFLDSVGYLDSVPEITYSVLYSDSGSVHRL